MRPSPESGTAYCCSLAFVATLIAPSVGAGWTPSRAGLSDMIPLRATHPSHPLLCGKEGFSSQTRGQTIPLTRGGAQDSVQSHQYKHLHEPSTPSTLRRDTRTSSFGRYIPQRVPTGNSDSLLNGPHLSKTYLPITLRLLHVISRFVTYPPLPSHPVLRLPLAEVWNSRTTEGSVNLPTPEIANRETWMVTPGVTSHYTWEILT